MLGLFITADAVLAQSVPLLNATRSDALYTTYAAPPQRSHYRTDQGYQFRWFDPEGGVEMTSREGPNLGIAFRQDGRLLFRLSELCREPVVTTSYSDLVKYCYYPSDRLRVEISFAVYSSETAVMDCRMVNEGRFPLAVEALPYFYAPSSDSLPAIGHSTGPESYTFRLNKKRDGWMTEHRIPLAEEFTGRWAVAGFTPETVSAFARETGKVLASKGNNGSDALFRSFALRQRGARYFQGVILTREFRLEPGDATTFRVVVSLEEATSAKISAALTASGNEAMKAAFGMDFSRLVREDEAAYQRIPGLKSLSRDQELLYLSAFSLMRQCMMPPEGSCRRNYYVFSREPRWGWGYGGQVFHESLSMLAYVHMDPQGAMNSQRIYFDRQRPDGYINYRTGPWLDETIVTNGKPTTSAPWFNYINHEVYKVTGDRQFLKEAYRSGSKFYRYFVANRDSNANGLCEWGAHAELESVRDARVAVWDKVGWASNFEGPDVNAMLVMEAKSLAGMAEALGLNSEARQWSEDATRRSDLINRFLWDEETGFFYNVNRNDHSFTHRTSGDLKIKEIIGFLPLWAGVTDRERTRRLMMTLLDTSEFWRPNGVPTLSAADPYYCPIGYWNGPVWVQWDYLIYRGLIDAGHEQEAEQLSCRVLGNMIRLLKSDHTFWEFYSADDRQAGWNRTYIWAGLAARFLIDAVPTCPVAP